MGPDSSPDRRDEEHGEPTERQATADSSKEDKGERVIPAKGSDL